MNQYVPMSGYSQPNLQFGAAPQTMQAPNINYGNAIPNVNLSSDALANFGGDSASYTSIGNLLGGNGLTGGNVGQGLGGWMASNGTALNAGVGLLTSGLGAWQGYNTNKLAKQQMNQQASQFNQQMTLSKGLLNQNMEDRQRARVASDPNTYQSVSEYMNKYGVK